MPATAPQTTATPKPAAGAGLRLQPLSGWLAAAAARASWRTLQRRFDQRPQRERLLLIAAAVALALMSADSLWLSPTLSSFKTTRGQQTQARSALAALQTELQALQNLGSSQARQQQSELATWRQRVREGDAALRQYEDTLVGPDRMLALLEQLLARQGQGQVRVRALRSLGRSDLLNPAPGSGAPDRTTTTAVRQAAEAPPPSDGTPPSLYRHGVELVLEGGFSDLLAYLRAVEALPQRVLWGSVSLKVEQHPKSVLTLRVYTISRERHWLEL